jgi:RND family efflux transporter MFP subunit
MIKRLLGIALVGAALVAVLLLTQHRKPPLRVSGFIEADEIRVGSRVGGRVMKVHVIEGQSVSAGDLLVELEPFDLLERRREAEARIEQTRATQQLAQITLDRIRPAFAQNAASKEEMDRAEAQLRLAAAGVDAAQASANAISAQIAELRITAPVSGVVEAVDLQAGDLVAANAPVLSLMDTSHLWVRAYLPENQLDVEVGRNVHVTVDSFKESFAAHISFIAREAEFTPGNIQTPDERAKQVFRVRVTLDDGLDRLRAGMSADVFLDASSRDPNAPSTRQE